MKVHLVTYWPTCIYRCHVQSMIWDNWGLNVCGLLVKLLLHTKDVNLIPELRGDNISIESRGLSVEV